MNTDPTDELTRLEPLPCPFCGEAPQTVGHVNIMVRCVTCMEPEAVTEGWMPLLRWNRRDELTRLRAENERLQTVIHEIYLEVEGDVDGAPDRSAVSSQANSIVNLIPEHLRK